MWKINVLMVIGTALSGVLIAAVALQNSKSDGFGAGLGGPGSSFRGSRQDEFLVKLTRVAGIAWLVVFALLAYAWNNTPR